MYIICFSFYSLVIFPEMVPSEVQGELKHLYVAAGELLRHFWSCFPVNTPFLEEKVTILHLIGRSNYYCHSELDLIPMILAS